MLVPVIDLVTYTIEVIHENEIPLIELEREFQVRGEIGQVVGCVVELGQIKIQGLVFVPPQDAVHDCLAIVGEASH